MEYPIVTVKTRDHVTLHGMLFEAKKPAGIVINIHGSASNFYEEDFVKEMALRLPQHHFSFLSTNNRGNAVLAHTWKS